jgi:ribonuclease P protein component
MAPTTPEPGGASLPKSARLLRRRDFLLVQQKGRKMADGLLLALALPGKAAVGRLGITVSSKVGNAVVRARIRRHVREAYRARRARWPRVDVVVIARGAAKDAEGPAFHKAFDALTAKLRQAFPATPGGSRGGGGSGSGGGGGTPPSRPPPSSGTPPTGTPPPAAP